MTTTQSFRIYEVLQRHFKNSDDAKIIVQEIEQIVEKKIENKGNTLAKGDIALLTEDLLKFQIDVEMRFYNSVLWTVGRYRRSRVNIFYHKIIHHQIKKFIT